MQRTPRNRAPFSQDQMRARARELQDARGNANRGPQGEEQGPSRRPFQLPRPPCLDEEADAESLDGIREEQPEEAEPFDQAWISILQKDRPECSIQKVLDLPMPSSFLLDSPIKWGVCMVMLGRGWGNGICLPWKPWPPVPVPTIPVVASKPVDAPAETQTQREEVQKMLAAGVIVPSNSPWTSPVVLVNKKDGSKRFCVDYRKLNDVTQKDVYPLPRTEEVLDELGKAQWFSKLDLKSGYWQIVVDPADRQKTAFITRDGLFEFIVMPFGLTAAPATFQRLMDTVLKGLLWKNVMVYLDDIIIYSKSWRDHVQALDDVFRRLRAANLKASASKCALGQTEMQYLGHLVTRDGILPDASNVQAVMDAAAPKTVRDVRSFLGMANYYSQFVEGFAAIARPLYQLTKKDTSFQWTDDCEDSFQALREALVSAPVLRRPDSALPYVLHGAHFTVQMDHWALKWLMSNEHRNGRLARWALKMQEYNFDVLHRKGALFEGTFR